MVEIQNVAWNKSLRLRPETAGGGTGDDAAYFNYGTFNGGPGDDAVYFHNDGTFYPGPQN